MYAVCFTVLLSYIKLLSILGVCLKCISKVHSVWVDCWVTECTHCMFDCVLLSILGVHVCLSVFRLRWSNRRRMDRQTIGWSSTSDSWTANHRLSWTRSVTNLDYLHDRFFLKQRFINVILFSVGASLRDRGGNSARWFWGSGLPPCVC